MPNVRPTRPGFVSICIPTFAAAPFIARTIECALNQTYPSIQIIISVDPFDDETLVICKSAALRDSRIRVEEQTTRLGWSQNTNAAIDLVDTEFAFIYFHDDLIEPTYVERLVAALVREPTAASAHCDLAEFGLVETVRKAHAYGGSSLERLADFLMTLRGTTLRSMLRMSALNSNVRFPHIVGDNRWVAYAFHLALLASGPAVAVPETLYRRWQRPGSLTRAHGWQATAMDETIASISAAAPLLIDTLERAISVPDERVIARYCLRLFLTKDLLNEQIRLRDGTPYDIDRLVPPLGGSFARFLPDVLRKETDGLVRDCERQISRLTDLVARIQKDDRAAIGQ